MTAASERAFSLPRPSVCVPTTCLSGGIEAFAVADPGASLRVGIFAGIHGDKPATAIAAAQLVEDLASDAGLLAGYDITIVPACNPAGLARGTREAACGRDLNREFWRDSNAPEVRALEGLLVSRHWDGIINLHADDTSAGCYGFVQGWELTSGVLEPALAAAARVLPRNLDRSIDNFQANRGIITRGYPGVLSAPPSQRPRPFEIVFETPGGAPLMEQAAAHRIAVRTMLAAYRELISHAQGI